MASTCNKRESQLCILAEGDEIIEQRIRTEPERFEAELGIRPPARVLIEASTDSEWVARCLDARSRGHCYRPELQGDEGRTALLVPADDPPAIAAAIEAYADDAAKRAQHGRAGRGLAEARFSLPAMVQSYLVVYDCARARRGSPTDWR